ncbi:hypothetical protein LCL96_16365 [Rossellomorea aquimaris]|uniref:hypothetical protein n=1 Tax=Rossellomorea aquimaris TaxID=189382 RepID=UPI001CD75F59|nr:hypothetical protein [Rossellomorea aquimaris]MCA1060513.1 hypothetical protein [Rossellomorea aquimaris]
MAVVGILGMTHDEEMQKTYNYPLSLVEELIGEFNPDIICGEVHPLSWELYQREGEPFGILGETQPEYPKLIFPLCKKEGIEFFPVNWFEEDVFEEGPFDRFDADRKKQLERELEEWNKKKLSTWDTGQIPFNSLEYDAVTKAMYDWLHTINPEVQQIVWSARHYIMAARVKNAAKKFPDKRILCIHGADHNYWYDQSLRNEKGIEVIYPIR